MEDTSKRNREIYALKKLGRSSWDIGIQFGISESRVDQIYKREKEMVKLENHPKAMVQNNNTAYSFYDALTDACDDISVRNKVYNLLSRAGVIQEMYDLDESLDLYSDESLLLIKSFGPKFLAIARKANEFYVQKKKKEEKPRYSLDVNVSYLDRVCQAMTSVLRKHRVYSVENIPESLLKKVLVTGDMTDLENYLNSNPVFCHRK